MCIDFYLFIFFPNSNQSFQLLIITWTCCCEVKLFFFSPSGWRLWVHSSHRLWNWSFLPWENSSPSCAVFHWRGAGRWWECECASPGTQTLYFCLLWIFSDSLNTASLSWLCFHRVPFFSNPNPQFEEEELEEGDEEVSVVAARLHWWCLNVSQPPCSWVSGAGRGRWRWRRWGGRLRY